MTAIDQAFIKAYLQPSETADSPSTGAAEDAEERSVSGAAGFQPMLQVDGFAWSDRATSLRLAAGIQVDRLADALAGGIAEGLKVVALGGCRRRQGCTTLLLCAAKRLAARGLKIAMVDADFDHPALAARLGLLPDAGLETVLAGRISLADAVIESIADQMALLPLAAPSTAGAAALEGKTALADALDPLRRSYDLVLVDLGEVGGPPDGEGPPEQLGRGRIDAMVLVQDVRGTPRAELVEAARRAERAGLVHAGVVENFV